jgi:3-oxoacyl-[acyl-carrier protein] reductase
MMDKVILITGGSKGIGLGIASVLKAQGAKVMLTGRNEESIQRAIEELNKIPSGAAAGMLSDVRDLQSEKDVVEKVLATWGKLDVVIANAGLGHFASIEDLTEEQWNQTIDTNLTGVFHTVKASIAALKVSKGYIITIGSLAGTNFFPSGSAYNASKFGLAGFSQAIMLDLRQYEIKVTTIMPGSVTSFFNDHTPTDKDSWKIQPEDLGQMVVDLLNMHPRTLPSKIEVRPSVPPK